MIYEVADTEDIEDIQKKLEVYEADTYKLKGCAIIVDGKEDFDTIVRGKAFYWTGRSDDECLEGSTFDVQAWQALSNSR